MAATKALFSQLSSRIDSLLEGFRNLSKINTIRDLANQSADVLKRIVPDTSVEMAHRPSPKDKAWEIIIGAGAQIPEKLIALSKQKTASASLIREVGNSICAIQRLADHTSIGFVFSRIDKAAGFSELDLLSLRLFIQLFENGYQNMIYHRNEKGLIFSLNHRILQLNSLIETGIEVEKLDHTSSPHHLALVRAASLTNASYASLRVTYGKDVREQYTFPEGISISRPSKDPNHIAAGFTFHGETFRFKLFDKESRSGIIAFEETDQLLLDALARQVHASIENRYLHQQALENQRIEQEIAVAAAIQQKILPVALPVIKGYDLAGINIPSKSVGGDYYDCLPLPDGRYALVIADVSGKGVAAALLVSSLHAYLTAYLEGPFALAELAARLNRVLYRASPDDKFITAFIAILSPDSGKIEYVNAGHNPAYVLNDRNSISELGLGGLPFGMFPDAAYQCDGFTMGRGERLLMYTDGIPEAQNEARELFERTTTLSTYFAEHKPESAGSFISGLIRDIKAFTLSAPQSDDITAMYLWRT